GATLPLRTEFSALLPEGQPSVVALRRLMERKPANAVVELGVASPSPEATRRFAGDLVRELRHTMPADLVREIDDDDGVLRSFVWKNRHLYAPLADLRRVPAH